MTTTTLFSCQACHSKGAAATKQRGNSSDSSSDSNVHFRQSKLRVLCVIPTVQPVPVQHHVAAAAAAQVASSFEFELVGILQRATHSLAPLALPSGDTALHFTVFSYAVRCLYPSPPPCCPTPPPAPLPCFAFIFFATFFLAFVHLPATVSMACKQDCAGQQGGK